MQNDERIHTAYNEAGHTVAYYHFKIPIISVTIIPDKKGHAGLTIPEEKTISVQEKIMISFAGPSAEQIHLGIVGPGTHYDRMMPYTKYNLPDDEITALSLQITKILEQPQYRRAVEKLATVLLKELSLEGPTAFSIIEKAIKEKD